MYCIFKYTSIFFACTRHRFFLFVELPTWL